MREEYEAIDLPFDRPGTRVERLEESVTVIKGLFGDSPLSHSGKHYRIGAVDGLPKPSQLPHPPLLIAGGSKRVLTLAGREADIAGVNPSLRAGTAGADLVSDMSPERIEEKLGWIRAGAQETGRSLDSIELQLSLLSCRITGPGNSERTESSLVGGAGSEELEASPAVLHGSVEQCVEQLLERRERYGFSYIKFGGDPEAAAPIVERLAGQ
jgi:alkanesulfonate monooxygenase SsuD/methylene tetrahydromethanopterin reductase-like flavin-dependent oxidoreductase (luciferase family)